MTYIHRTIVIPAGKKAYFTSDFHFGIPDAESSREREKRVCRWLDKIRADASHLFLLGDLFDAWLEYKTVIPKGNTRFLGKLAELSDAGVVIYFFTGNHDLWTRDYFPTELGIEIIHTHLTFQLNDTIVHLGHGDGIGPGDERYKLLKAVLRNRFCQFLYRQLHPDVGIRLANYFSQQGPKHKYAELEFLGVEKEYQMLYAKELLQQHHYDYFVFGHRHIPNKLPLGDRSTFINLGDWLSYNTYAVFDGSMELHRFEEKV